MAEIRRLIDRDGRSGEAPEHRRRSERRITLFASPGSGEPHMPGDKRTTVVHVTNCWYPLVGGITTNVAGLARATERYLGLPTQVIAYPGTIAAWVAKPGWRAVRRLVHGVIAVSVVARACAAALWHRLRRRATIVHSHSAGFCLVAGALATLVGCKSIHTVHSAVFDGPQRLGWGRGIYRWAARRARVIVYCCEFLRKQQEPLLEPKESDVIFYGVEDPLAEALPEATHLRAVTGNAAGRLILWAGHLIERKDPLLAVEAMPLLPDAHLVFLGDGPLREAIAERAGTLGVAPRIHLLGAVTRDKVLRYLIDADLLLITSRAEGIPLVVFEAMMAGTPVVAAPVSGIPEMVIDGETGFLIDERTGAAVATAVTRALDTAIAGRVVEQARARVREGSSWEAMARRYAPWYGIAPTDVQTGQ